MNLKYYNLSNIKLTLLGHHGYVNFHFPTYYKLTSTFQSISLTQELSITYPQNFCMSPNLFKLAWMKDPYAENWKITNILIWDQIKIIWQKSDLRSDQIAFSKSDLIWFDLIWSEIFRSFSDHFPNIFLMHKHYLWA